MLIAGVTASGQTSSSVSYTSTQAAQYFRYVFACMTNERVPADARKAFASAYAAQYGLNQRETALLATLAGSYQTSAQQSQSQAMAIWRASGQSALPQAQQQMSALGTALDNTAATLGGQLLTSLRAPVAQAIQAAINRK